MTTNRVSTPKPARRKRTVAAQAEPLLTDGALAGLSTLRTERLVLRRPRPEDADALHNLINDWDVVRTLAVVPFPYPRSLADEFIAATAREMESGTACYAAITGTEGNVEMLLGVVSIRIDAASRTGNLGYWVGRRFWGHGVATEAVSRLVSWSLANLPIDRLRADVATDNPSSAAVLRRVGFRQTGEGTAWSVALGTARPTWQFGAEREDIFGHMEVAVTEPGEKPLLLVAACALVDTDGRVLLARRPEGKKMAGLWEFPGGKLDPGETPEVALIRELREELGIDVTASCLAPFAFASHAYERFHLLMPLYLCRRWKGVPTAKEGQTLAWVRARQLDEYAMPPADKPLIPLLRDFL